MSKATVAAVLAAAAIISVPAMQADAAHHRTHTSATADNPGSMTLEEWYQIGEGQQQSNVQDVVCDCVGYVLRKYTVNGVDFKEVQYPAMGGSIYGDIIRYRQTNNGRNLTDGYKYLTRDGEAVPFHYGADGLVD